MGILSGMFGEVLGNPRAESFPEEPRCSIFEKSRVNYAIFLSLRPAKGHSAADKAFPSALCENTICGNKLCWLFLHVLSQWSKEQRWSFKSTLIWVVYLVLDGRNADWNTVFTRLLLNISRFRVCMGLHLCVCVCVWMCACLIQAIICHSFV